MRKNLIRRALCFAAAFTFIAAVPWLLPSAAHLAGIPVESFQESFVSHGASSVEDVVKKLERFEESFEINNKDAGAFFKEVYEQAPHLLVYYSGISYRTSGKKTTVEVTYQNRDVKEIYVANGLEEVYKAVAHAMLNCEDKMYIVRTEGKENTLEPDRMMEWVHTNAYLAYLGYQSCNVTSYENTFNDAVFYEITMGYHEDPATLMQYKQELSAKLLELSGTVFARDMPDYRKVKEIHDYIINNCAYDLNQNGDLASQSAYGTLVLGKSVCEGYATAAKLLFDAAGIENVYVRGEAGGVGHAWNAVKLDGFWYHIDLTWDDPVTQDGRQILRYDYFNLTDGELAKDHIWDRTAYPSCTGTFYTSSQVERLIREDQTNYAGYVNDDSFLFKGEGVTKIVRTQETIQETDTAALGVAAGSVLGEDAWGDSGDGDSQENSWLPFPIAGIFDGGAVVNVASYIRGAVQSPVGIIFLILLCLFLLLVVAAGAVINSKKRRRF